MMEILVISLELKLPVYHRRPIESSVIELEESGGTCLAIKHVFKMNERFDTRKAFLLTRKRLTHDITLVHGINSKGGIWKKKRLRTIRDVLYCTNRSLRKSAREVLTWIENSNIERLREGTSARDAELLFCVDPSRINYLDIETTGMRDTRIFLIALGILNVPANTLETVQFLARNLDEEYMVCKQTLDMLQRYPCMISYNGKAFDGRVLDERFFYYFNTGIDDVLEHHVDLLHEVRHFTGASKCMKLGDVERSILRAPRSGDIPSRDIPDAYQVFINAGNHDSFTRYLSEVFQGGDNKALNSSKLAGDSETSRAFFNMYRVIHHNFIDILSLHSILMKILQTVHAGLITGCRRC